MPHAQVSTASPRRPERQIGGIGALAAAIDAACSGASEHMGGGIRAALKQAVAEPGLLGPEQCLGRNDCYARHILYADPAGRFTIIAIVWSAGQFSPPHAHHAWCAYGVYENTLKETTFAWDAGSATARPRLTEAREPGYSCFADAGLDQIHRLGNAGSRPAISIHVYGVERENIATHVNRMVEVASA